MTLPDYRIQNVLKAYSNLVQESLSSEQRDKMSAKRHLPAGMGEISFERRTTVVENNVRDLMVKLSEAAREQRPQTASLYSNDYAPESMPKAEADIEPGANGFSFSVIDSQADCQTKRLFIEEDDLFFKRIGKPIAPSNTQNS